MQQRRERNLCDYGFRVRIYEPGLCGARSAGNQVPDYRACGEVGCGAVGALKGWETDRICERRGWAERDSRAEDGGPKGGGAEKSARGSRHEFALESGWTGAGVFADERARAGRLLFVRCDDGKAGAVDDERNGGEDRRVPAGGAGAVEEL